MRKYLLNGQEVEVVRSVEGGFLIKEIHYFEDEGYEDDWVDEKIIFVEGNVYDKPPLVKFANKIAEYESKIEKLREEKLELAAEIQDMKIKNEERFKEYKRYDALKHLDRFLNEEITHYAILTHWQPEIIEVSEAKSDYEPKSLKLLSLFGRSDGNLEWRLSYYSDGSGGYQTVVPCVSYEEACQELQDLIFSEEVTKNRAPNSKIIEVAKKHNLKLADGYLDAYEKNREEGYRKSIAKKKEELAYLEKELKSA